MSCDETEQSASAEPGASHEQISVTVRLQRTVRFGRIITIATVLGVALATISSLCFPVAVDAQYTLRQAAGLAAVFGGVVGLAAGSICSLVLVFFARRENGVATAVQTHISAETDIG